MTPLPWQELAARKRASLDASIPQEWKLDNLQPLTESFVLDVPRKSGKLSAAELELTETRDATALLQELSVGLLKSVDVVSAFLKRAAIAHQLTKCLTEFFPEKALERAQFLDSYFDQHKKPFGPLHGLPISLKDSFRIKGYDSSIGLAALSFQPAKENSTLVDLLHAAGAVLYCKTNVPQTLGQLDTHNNVFGRTLNPHNSAVTAGGSSGGEGVLIALRGSVLGVGTDVAGSIRIPAMCNGIYGVKPSWQRVPFAGQEGTSLPGLSQLSVAAAAGPIASSLRDCETFLRIISGMKPWEADPDVIFGTWEGQSNISSRPVIGLVKRDGLIDPLPPIAALLDEVVSDLRTSGVEVVEVDISKVFSKCQSLVNALLSVDGGNYMLDLVDKTGEPLSPWLKSRIRRSKPMSFDQVRELQARRKGLESQFLKMWKTEAGKNIDAFICPVAPHPVPPLDRWNGVSYTSTFNLLDYPAGVIPVRKFGARDLEGHVASTPVLGSWDKVNRGLWTEIEREVYINTPLGIQVVAPKLQEKRLLEAMKVIEKAIIDNQVQKRRAKL